MIKAVGRPPNRSRRAGTAAADPAWKTQIHPSGDWRLTDFDDSGWKKAVAWVPAPGPDAEPLGHPWIPDSVKAFRHTFDVGKQIKSARLYATALGAYELFLNGKRVSEDVLAPGWTDYRERAFYQTYDVTAMLGNGRNAIAALLPHGQARHDVVATKLGMSPRTLARRLSAESSSFAAILDEMRSALAHRYLADPTLPISQIAWLVGYTEVGTFTRAFQRWTGLSPSAARARH